MASFFPSKLSLVLLLLLSATTFNISKMIRCNEKDRRVLSTFKARVEDPYNRLSSWSNEEDCCAWIGVHCDNLTGRVTMLDLHNNPQDYLEQTKSLVGGEISLSNLLQLEFLNYLDLSFNNFEAISIPPSKSPPNISKLEHLDLSYNHLGMVIDHLRWLSPLSSLKYLNLSVINLSKETNWLHSVAMLPSLSKLGLSYCGLTNISPSLNYVNFSSSLVTLDLSANNFNSELPNWLFNLTSAISYLDLGGSNFYAQIPISLLRLSDLQSLKLGDNKLSGSIPYWLGQHEQLQHLDLSNNLLSGSIPSTLANLTTLTDLAVGGNSLVGVLSKSNFSGFSNLGALNLDSTGLKFELDSNWVPPFQLHKLSLRNVSLGPNFPSWLYTLKSLDLLDISSSRISSIDDEHMFWSFLARIGDVDISHNSISGDLSEVTLNSTYIDLSYNDFTGELPHISSNLISLIASHNSFSGKIFSVLCHHGENAVESLDISNNVLTGQLPDCWANWNRLVYLDLGSNKLSGELPPSMVTLSSLLFLDLHNNSLFGEFSFNLSSLSNLEYLNLAENKFFGSLPKLQPSLGVIQLRSNQFIGRIPPNICNLPNLMILDLADNMLFGSIPHCVYNTTAMFLADRGFTYIKNINLVAKGREVIYNKYGWQRIIDLSNNILSGEIPPELFSLIQLWSLNLSRNHLSGKIPKEIGGMKNLECLDLSHNKLSGEIPQSISNLSFLSNLNLSYNNLIGQIPVGTQIQSFEAWSFIGNPELCGAPLKINCTEPEKQKQKELEEGDEDEDDIFLKSLYLGMGVGFAVGFWVVCGSLFCIRAWRHRFFQWFDGMVDGVYVAMALKFKS